MKATVYLVCNTSGVLKMLKERPLFGVGEQAVEVRLEIPDSLFYPPPIPRVEITLTDEAVPHVRVIQEALETLANVGVKANLVDEKGRKI